MNYLFKTIQPTPQAWAAMAASPDCSVFFTPQWAEYLHRMGERLIMVEVRGNTTTVGYFVGTHRWVGIRIVTAPSIGTGTYAQGLCMLQPVSADERLAIYQQLADWLFKSRQASYIQICDWALHNSTDRLDAFGLYYNHRHTYAIDLRPDESELWASLHYKSCKYCINKARKEGLTVREVTDKDQIAAFAEYHSSHLADMMRRKSSRGLPCQRHKNILALCQSLFPDNVLMLDVITPDGLSIASSLFAYTNGVASYYTAASLTQYLPLCPNELIVWEAMQRLHNKGVTELILGGVAHYKKKYSPFMADVPVLVFSRHRALLGIRKRAKTLYQQLFYKK